MTPFSTTLKGSGGAHHPKAPTQASNQPVPSPMTKIDLDVGVQDESSSVPVDRPPLRKVLGIVYGLIMFTTLLIGLFVSVGSIKAFVLEQKGLFLFFLYTWMTLNILASTKKGFGPIKFCKYTLAVLFTASSSYVVAYSCCKTNFNTMILAAGIAMEIFFFLLVISLFAKIGDIIWSLISMVWGVGVIIFGLIVLIMSLTGSLTNEYVTPSLILSFLILAFLIDIHKTLGIGWYTEYSEAIRKPDMWLYSSLELSRDLMCTFVFFIILLDDDFYCRKK